ncbi:hypothetical protein G6F65_018057 [Rhizopus arrhizus]|nr:hypothetical protein G6F65_018057 [Rhizopus arrhizus]
MGANYYLDYRRSQYATTTDRLNAITGDIHDQARLENIKMDMKMARADEAQAKKELSSVDLNIAKMREELDKMRDKVDQYREVAEKERAANGGMTNKQLDSEITKMNQRVASLQSEVDGLTVSLAIAMATLAGCATTAADCDPSNSDVSILTKMSCDGSGQYRGHIDRAEQDLISAQEANARFRQIHADIEAQRQAVGQSLAAQRAQQLALNKSLGDLLGKLKARYANKRDVTRQIADLEKTLQDTNKVSTNPADIQAKQKNLQALQAKAKQLQDSLVE